MYLFDPITGQKSETTYEKLVGITGQPQGSLQSYKCRHRKLKTINCYIIDENTPNSLLKEMMSKEKIVDEYWVDIPGTQANQVSSYGRYRVKTKRGYMLMLIYNASPSKATITLSIDGKKQKLLAHTKVAELFLDKPDADNFVVTHKDENSFNCRAGNLMYIDKNKLAKRTGPLSRRIAVLKIDPETGETLDEYRSMREASRKNYLSHESVSLAIREKRLCAGYKYVIDDFEIAQ